jgi:CSLREA domain-containing protein
MSSVLQSTEQGLPAPKEHKKMIELSEKRPVGSKNTKKILALGIVVAALVALSLMLIAQPARADITFTVNSTGDPGSGGCNRTECTLREAIASTNRFEGADTIRFDIPGEGVKTISPTSELPEITEAVTIDGYSQPGAKENTQQGGSDAVLLIQLDGSKAGDVEGLRITTSSVMVRGLVINRFGENGVVIEGSSATGNTVEGNRIGTDPTGTQILENDDGIKVSDGAGDNLIGGPAARNLIRSNHFDGVLVSGSTGSQVKANTIALNEDEGVEIRADSTRSRILSDSIFSNDDPSTPQNELGIDLGNLGDGDGSTPNDPGDADEGANGLRNKPTIRSAVTSGSSTTLKGRLDSTPKTSFTVQFFANPSGGDEGKKFIGQKRVTTNTEGKVTYAFSPSQKVGVGKTVTATATGPEGTSEFSVPRTVVSA